jgi:hypothetical protein
MARICFAAALCGLLASSCAYTRTRPRLSLAHALQLLPAMGTGTVLTEKFGEPDYRASFFDSDPKNPFNAQRMSGDESRQMWRRILVSMPAGLLDTLPISTKMLGYVFSWAPLGLNGTRTGLWVCVNDSDQIVGWFYGKELEGYEKEAGLD